MVDERTTELLTPEAIQLIFKHEVSGGQKAYEARYLNPVWPEAQSGVTIGIGYDLGYTAMGTFKSEWAGRIPDRDIQELCVCINKKGLRAKALLPQVRHIRVPWAPARAVFIAYTLPRSYALTARVFPGLEDLPKNAQGALVSLVMNRGEDMTGARRVEMRAIRDLVPRKDLAGIAREIQKMKRLWVGKGVGGLLTRRDDEAALVESCIPKGAP
jgi:GH24 family phage-related lysozyme (muramidase)